jgi:CHASE3 domain sensor protein
MRRSVPSPRGIAIILLTVNLFTVAVVVGGVQVARNASDQGEDALVALVDDVTRVSQAQAAAERMLVVGRGYLLTEEPELLARAHAAEAKLTRTIRAITVTQRAADDRRQLDELVAKLKHYRETFSALLSGEKPTREPREIAAALKGRLTRRGTSSSWRWTPSPRGSWSRSSFGVSRRASGAPRP